MQKLNILPYKKDFRIQSKYIVHRTDDKDKTEKFEVTTSDQEIRLKNLIISFKFSSFMSNRKEFCLLNLIVFHKIFGHY